MRIIDARSGSDVAVGSMVNYGRGVWWKMLDLKKGLFTAHALIENHDADKTWTQWVPLQIRFTHPRFFLQRIAFVPT